ncbi:MAG: hypothetical protein E7191_03775 [Erysipelotrichaceae bacterium]|nr:hypothetical protein [Erysipelotrichaceae bacterium]
MLKRIKGLLCIWLVVLMFIGTVSASPYPVWILKDDESPVSGNSVGELKLFQVNENEVLKNNVEINEFLNELAPGLELSGWDIWYTEQSGTIYSGKVQEEGYDSDLKCENGFYGSSWIYVPKFSPIQTTPVELPKTDVYFSVDGETWRTYSITRGEDIKMPEVPKKEGYVGTWDHDGKGIRTTTTINAVYTKLANTTDLSAYSNDQLEIYKNSRVHTLLNEDDITIGGYMFKYKTDCNKPDSIWREIIFVREDNYDTKYAYRKQADSVYATWLNDNPNATANGKYDLDYANYSVTFDVDEVNAYDSNTPVGKMESGSYLMYMRISDGVNSNIMPLVDRVLTDGTTMENTGTLPKGFEVVDQETRVLRYVIE